MNSTKNSLIVPAIIASLALIACSLVVTRPIQALVSAKKSITVTGSAKKQIKSDLATWNGNFSRQGDALPDVYGVMKADQAKIKAYLVAKGIPEKDITFQPVWTETIYAGDPKTGRMTNEVMGYRMMQSVQVRSTDVEKITTLSREASELIDQGVVFQSNPPQYLYTKLNDVKIDMLAEAAKDAATRAEKMAAASGSKVGHLRAAKMGVFQITPLNSTEVADYGINDTSSLDKEITAVVNAEFALE
ncbi:MAG: SIMPL domain-containing protein [Firmicutes bacterium]|nr:SIMPL domain-containing protein [Bacillota bacterium]